MGCGAVRWVDKKCERLGWEAGGSTGRRGGAGRGGRRTAHLRGRSASPAAAASPQCPAPCAGTRCRPALRQRVWRVSAELLTPLLLSALPVCHRRRQRVHGEPDSPPGGAAGAAPAAPARTSVPSAVMSKVRFLFGSGGLKLPGRAGPLPRRLMPCAAAAQGRRAVAQVAPGGGLGGGGLRASRAREREGGGGGRRRLLWLLLHPSREGSGRARNSMRRHHGGRRLAGPGRPSGGVADS